MIERVIYDAIGLDLAAILATPTLLDGIFQPEGRARVSNAELVTIKACLAQFPPKVRLGYPYSGTHLPCWAILLGDETQEKQLLGNYLCDDDAPPVGTAVELIGSIERRVYSILTCGVTPDMAIWYSKILKSILLRRIHYLQTLAIEVSGYSVQDLEPMQLAPEIAFMRAFNLVCRVEEAVGGEPFALIGTLTVAVVPVVFSTAPVVTP